MTTTRTPRGKAKPCLKNTLNTPSAQAITLEILTELLQGNLLTIQGCVDRFQKTYFGTAKEYCDGLYPGDPDTFFNWGLPHLWVEHQGERFALIRPDDFPVFMDRICDTSADDQGSLEDTAQVEEITFDQALNRILSERHNPKLVAEQEARLADPIGKVESLEFRMWGLELDAQTLLEHENEEVRSRSRKAMDDFLKKMKVFEVTV